MCNTIEYTQISRHRSARNKNIGGKCVTFFETTQICEVHLNVVGLVQGLADLEILAHLQQDNGI